MLYGRLFKDRKPGGAAPSIAILCIAASLSGCGDGMAKVRGTVTLDGAQIVRSDTKQCNVTFVPASGRGAKASGTVDPNGVYELSTGATRGLEPGDYTASVRVREITPPGDRGGYPMSKTVSPDRYANPSQSGLQFTVKSGSNTIDLELTSAE